MANAKTLINANVSTAGATKPKKLKTIFIINIKEYFKEEFKKNSTPKDYKTKVSISKIENRIFKYLKKIGIKNKDIVVVEELLEQDKEQNNNNKTMKEKKIKITIHDFKIISKIMNIKDKKGIAFMHMSKVEDKK